MQVRLTDDDMKRVGIVQRHFADLKPIAVELATADVVRIGLRELAVRLGEENEQSAAGKEQARSSVEQVLKNIPKRRRRGLLPPRVSGTS